MNGCHIQRMILYIVYDQHASRFRLLISAKGPGRAAHDTAETVAEELRTQQ